MERSNTDKDKKMVIYKSRDQGARVQANLTTTQPRTFLVSRTMRTYISVVSTIHFFVSSMLLWYS